MSIQLNQQGKITLEPTNGNVLGITEIVLQHFEKTLLELQERHPELLPDALRAMARDELEKNIQRVTEVVVDSCRKAMMSRPEDALRKDLVGRILIHRLESRLGDDLTCTKNFPRQFIPAILNTVREIIGDTHYNNLNEHSVRPSLEYCIVHELGQSKIAWDDFYNQNLVSILLIRLKNIIKRWLQATPTRLQEFIDTVNAQLETEHHGFFNQVHCELLLDSWGLKGLTPLTPQEPSSEDS